jgi:hypothetical protein
MRCYNLLGKSSSPLTRQHNPIRPCVRAHNTSRSYLCRVDHILPAICFGRAESSSLRSIFLIALVFHGVLVLPRAAIVAVWRFSQGLQHIDELLSSAIQASPDNDEPKLSPHRYTGLIAIVSPSCDLAFMAHSANSLVDAYIYVVRYVYSWPPGTIVSACPLDPIRWLNNRESVDCFHKKQHLP